MVEQNLSDEQTQNEIEQLTQEALEELNKGSDWTDWKKKEMKHWHSSIGAVFEVQSGAKIARVAKPRNRS